MSTRKTIKSAIESMMFIWGEPLHVKDIADIFNIERKEAYECCRELMREYDEEGRGIVIREVNRAFQFTTRKENMAYIERLCTPVRHRRLSQSALETLAIVAYRQPVTKGEIEAIRGIRCDRVMEGLVKKGLVQDVGRSEAVGRPILYGTTDEFLKLFGFESIRELPDIKDIEDMLDEDLPESGLDGVSLQQISLEELSGGAKAEAAGEEPPAEDQPEEAAVEEAVPEAEEPAEETSEETPEEETTIEETPIEETPIEETPED